MYVILKQLLPVIEGDVNFQYIDYCIEIPGDQIYKFDTIEQAEIKKIELQNNSAYAGRNLKIEECQ